MKKLLSVLIALFCMGTVTQAQVCKISQTNDNVEVHSCYLTNNNSTVSVIVGNDSQNNAANVTVEVKVVYQNQWGKKTEETYFGRGLAKANDTTEIKISIPSHIDSYEAVSVSVTSISGTKCI